MTATVPLPAVVTAVKERVSPSASVSLAITSVLVIEASSATVKVLATATGASFSPVIVIETVAAVLSTVPSFTLKVKLSLVAVSELLV